MRRLIVTITIIGILTLFAHGFALYQLLTMECVTSERILVLTHSNDENVYKNLDVCIKWKNR